MNRRKIAFVLAATADHGLMIVNQFDQHTRPLAKTEGEGYLTFGVGVEMLETGQYSPEEIQAGKTILDLMRRYRTLPLRVYDVGANIGTHTIAWGDHLRGWGQVYAYEPQRILYYALCGNIVINNLHENVFAINAAVGVGEDVIKIPKLDYSMPASYGSLELRPSVREKMGQDLDYENGVDVGVVELDMDVDRIDLLKIDAEGMEMDVLLGASETIKEDHPVLMLEWLKSDQLAMKEWLEAREYRLLPLGRHTWVCLHQGDPVLTHIKEATPGYGG